MANRAHIDLLDLLLTDVNEWNDWREKNPLIIPDLEGANLQEKIFAQLSAWH